MFQGRQTPKVGQVKGSARRLGSPAPTLSENSKVAAVDQLTNKGQSNAEQ